MQQEMLFNDNPMTSLKATVRFDGGCLGNPGLKYASYEIALDGNKIAGQNRVQLGHGTNNEAEFDGFIIALDALLEYCARNKIEMVKIELLALTDSMVVVGRMKPRKKPRKDKDERAIAMQALADQCRERLNNFGKWSVVWNGRENNVETFGH